ncbi:putative HAT dimerization domain, ribonuclease H-like domain, hAT-like transposase, RNase-H [Rosa chinensis]|uniref:Putative HAT dimerization domain, ribonuclease H-like domain, hAT-like transposase, RNase-H n=1 Tax=Rosa chinensis TaxID=74649 RepID=A0A2P6RAM8_ROSCH|nr:putative HAT dimerization domain, ribonuclease H-like domain, hAT-like transposase, RNase-H [Rosa chinensis]
MLEIAIKYRKAFLRLEDEDSQFESYFNERVGGKKRAGPPIGLDWEKAARLVKFLKIFYDATLKFSGTQVVTANQPLLWMCTIIGELDKCIQGDDSLLLSIGNSMKKKFDKYWGRLEELNKILLIAVVLDPRYKLLYLEYFFPKLQQDESLVASMVNEVKSMFMQLFLEYAENDPEAAQASFSATQPKFDAGNASLVEEDSYAASMNEFMKLRQEKDVVEIKNEVDKYLLEPSEDPSNPSFQVLDWWKENCVRFPILSQIARDVMAVPASTVASESAFSLGKRILDPFRSSLTPKMVEALVCSSDWLRGTSKPLFKEPTRVEMEQYAELEKMEADSGVTNVGDLPEETV